MNMKIKSASCHFISAHKLLKTWFSDYVTEMLVVMHVTFEKLEHGVINHVVMNNLLLFIVFWAVVSDFCVF